MKLGTLLGDRDRFEIEHQIGAGGMGKVFRARDRQTGEPVAVKIISDRREHRAARFAREVELLAELTHPGIVRYIAHGEMPGGARFLVMEWLDGEDLKARLARGPLTGGEALELATRVAEALGQAHARGIVHRDLKPSNLFLPGGRIDQVKILDFGIARREGRPHLTKTGTLLGTPGYMAPEQARSARGEIDARADVFALGCVLFQCVTGAPPFDADSAAGILSKILFDEAPRLSELWPEVPQDLDALIAQMLAKEPAQRPSNGAHLAAALAALMSSVPGAIQIPAAHAERAARPPERTGGERRFLSVVLLGPATEDGAPGDAAGDTADEAALRQASAPFGGRLERLADGSTVVVIEPDRQVATDQAARAAHCALALRALARHRPIALAMGRDESTRTLPEGSAIDRAASLLARQPPAPDAPPPIALDEVIAGLLDARFDVVEGEAGLALHGERALARGARTLLGRPTSCVGRDWELGMLTALLDECIDESTARAVVVTAAAGIGKSRLAAELVRRVGERDAPVAIWIGRGSSQRAGSTLDLLAQALRGALGIGGGEPLAERRDRLRARVAEHVPAAERQRVAEFLGELIGTPFAGEVTAALVAARQDAQLMSEQMRRAWLDFLAAEAAARPVLLVLEDLQWGDFGTVRFLDSALRDAGKLPWMMLALARPEVFEVFPKLWAGRQNLQVIRLKELGRKAGERLVRQVLGDTARTETVERLVNLAEGNAFYLEELIRAVAEGRGGELPETVLAMVETRLGRLSHEARQVLRAASVFGEVCWEGGVVALLDGVLAAPVVGEWLDKLGAQEMLAVRPESRFAGERELVFRHALLREGAYATFTEEDRRRKHRLAGEWLEQHDEADAMVLAGHFERGADRARAAGHYLQAAEQALHVLDLQAMMARTRLGLACEPSEALRRALLGMRCEAATYGWHLLGEVMPDAAELVRSTPPGSLPWAQAVLSYLAGSMAAGRMQDLWTTIESLRAVTPVPEAMPRMALAYVGAITILDNLGRIADAAALVDKFASLLGPADARGPRHRFWWSLIGGMRSAYADEDPWRGYQHSVAMRASHQALGGERMLLSLHLLGGLNLWFLGAGAEAERLLVAIPAADEAMGPTSSLRRFALAWLLADRGALEEARAVATQLAEHGHAHRLPLEEARGRWALAEVLRRLGDLEGAEREAAAALRVVVPLERPGVLGTLAMLRLAQGRAADALATADEAVAACAAMGGCGMFRGAFVRLARAEALHATGALDAARAAIADARARLAVIAARIPDPEHRQRFLERVPENARTFALARAWLGEAP
ncbi:MAG TPA: protein kinase [Kofleriaceae bacterium]|nr:protein kinase [Kofleriaceae bacterium]